MNKMNHVIYNHSKVSKLNTNGYSSKPPIVKKKKKKSILTIETLVCFIFIMKLIIGRTNNVSSNFLSHRITENNPSF